MPYSKYHIDVKVKDDDGVKWRFTGIYGEPKTEKKYLTWKLLKILKNQMDMPWLVAGDFNEILYGHEKQGGKIRAQGLMDNFKETLKECELTDLGFEGDMFTWRNNSRTKEGYIRERLDRAIANSSWRNRFSEGKVINGDPYHSDHRPIIILTENQLENQKRGFGEIISNLKQTGS